MIFRALYAKIMQKKIESDPQFSVRVVGDCYEFTYPSGVTETREIKHIGVIDSDKEKKLLRSRVDPEDQWKTCLFYSDGEAVTLESTTCLCDLPKDTSGPLYPIESEALFCLFERWVEYGKFTQINPNSDGNYPVAEAASFFKPGNKYPDSISCQFSCNRCQETLKLLVNTYNGQLHFWRPKKQE